MKRNNNIRIVIAGFFFLLFIGCNNSKENATSAFEVLTDKTTGLHFNNKLTPTPDFNMFNYMYFYNGAGIGAGDFNNDGLIDLYFAANQEKNLLYLNKGELKFSDVTVQAKIPQDGGWSTGVSVIDINNDGLLDIYVCKVGNYEKLKSKNQLLLCKGIDKNGIPSYEDAAMKYGLDFSGFSTQALFFDYDLDGDPDMFLLNHSVHQDGSFAPRSNFSGTYHPLSGDRLFRNDGTFFSDVTKEAGINSSAISYGLGIVAADFNLDGWPDLYAGNDFHENDYLYVNQKNGTFTDESNEQMMHTSEFSMGVDAGDMNNDGYPEIISMDMLPADPVILKRSLGDDDYDVFQQKLAAGYSYQYSRNNLQYNRRNGLYSEIGLYSGIAATDWSWAPLMMDFDNDGLKDLFIANGIPKRLNDMDYINFVSNEEIQEKLHNNQLDDKNMALVNKFPEIKIPNKFYKNSGQLLFNDIEMAIKNNQPTYSNGAIYADLDNDGDLDIVVNNINDPVLIYQNKCNDKIKKTFASVKLTGSDKNINAIGAKIILFADSTIRTYENYPVKGFQSSMQTPIHIGLSDIKIDSSFLIWPDNSYQRIQLDTNKVVSYLYKTNLPIFNYSIITSFQKPASKGMVDITNSTGLNYTHQENAFIEFNREALIPHMLSTEGPALAVGDINKDGLDDVFVGASKSFHNEIFLQQTDGKFSKSQQPGLFADSLYEDVDAVFTDVNNDSYPDLVIASGGNEFYGMDKYMMPRLYLNDTKGRFKKSENAFDNIFMTASSVVPFDFNQDGFMDLFIGGRAVPYAYGELPNSYLLQNDGTGKFKDVSVKNAEGLSKIGLVTYASVADIDTDGDKDLLICCEWGGIYAFINNKGVLKRKILTEKNGWWNFVLPVDADGDGDVDLIAGNLGLNSRLQANSEQPVRMYVNDFDDNGKKEQIVTYYVNGKEAPFASKDELQKQIPLLKKKFLYAGDFAKSSIKEIFSTKKIENATVFSADYFSNALLINEGSFNFKTVALPWQAQLSTYKDAAIIAASNDKLPDILLVGNYYDNSIQMGRYDADFGTLLMNRGNNNFSAGKINGLSIKGQIRRIKRIRIKNTNAFILARNNDTIMVLQGSDE